MNDAEQRIAEWKANNPQRTSELEQQARTLTDQFLDERRSLRESDLDAYMKIVNNEPSASRDPDLYYAKQLRTLVATAMREDAIAKRQADFERAREEKLAARAAERALKQKK